MSCLVMVDIGAEYIFTDLINKDKFDPVQNLVYSFFKITGRYYETDEAFEIRREIEQFLIQNENLHWSEILDSRRIFEEPVCIIEKGVVSGVA